MKAVGNASECFTRMRSGIYGKLETILSLGIVSPLSAEHSRCIGAALSFASIFASLALAQEAGTIGSPADGTVIKPNGVFDFQNNTRADYSTSSYAFSVWLLTETPSGFVSSDVWCTGHYFGRFDEANYPGQQYLPAYDENFQQKFSRSICYSPCSRDPNHV